MWEEKQIAWRENWGNKLSLWKKSYIKTKTRKELSETIEKVIKENNDGKTIERKN